MHLECEAKIRVEDLEAVRNRLRELEAVDGGECLERNWVLDDARESLRRRTVLLRVRNVGGDTAVMTIKTPADKGEFKSRHEIETTVDSTDRLLLQLEALGFHVTWIYEKRRHSWQWGGCVIDLDECPELGCFVEIEGAPKRIREAARALGLDPKAHIDDNYRGLWMKYLKERGQAPRDMVFPRAARGKGRARKAGKSGSPMQKNGKRTS